MSYGKMNSFIDILSTKPIKDSEGFSIKQDTILASIRAYKEERNGSERWANRSVFSDAAVLFRFRTIPGIDVTTSLVIVCENKKYNITSVEDVKGRGMYIEVLAKIVDSSVDK